MFKNADRDPLGIPTRVARRSVGPTHRIAGTWADTKALWRGEPNAAQQEIHKPHTTGPGGFNPFHPDNREAPEHQPDVAAGPNPFGGQAPAPALNPFQAAQDARTASWYTDQKPTDAAQAPIPTGNGVKTDPKVKTVAPSAPAATEQKAWKSPVPTPTPRKIGRILDAEARTFLADQNVDDREELLYRARRHAATLTSTWSPEASQRTAAAFTDRVASLIPSMPRVAATEAPTSFEDFDDQLMF